MPDGTANAGMTRKTHFTILDLPDEVLCHILWHLDVPELLDVSRTTHRLRTLALDPHNHHLRLSLVPGTLTRLLPSRPLLNSLQPPSSTIYLTRTHLAARRLHWSLVRIRLARSLSRRPALSSLVYANILPRECCRRDRSSGEYLVSGAERGGLVAERKRKVEREKVKEGLRVWLERKAGEIRKRRKEGGVGVMVWRFTKRLRVGGEEARVGRKGVEVLEGAQGRVEGLRNFWEGVGGGERAVIQRV